MEVVWEPSYIISSWVFKCTSVNLVWVWAYDFVLKATRIGTDRYMSLWSELCECAQRYTSVCSKVNEFMLLAPVSLWLELCVSLLRGMWVCAWSYVSVWSELCEWVLKATQVEIGTWVSSQRYIRVTWLHIFLKSK